MNETDKVSALQTKIAKAISRVLPPGWGFIGLIHQVEDVEGGYLFCALPSTPEHLARLEKFKAEIEKGLPKGNRAEITKV